jgi:hypothetical protein
MFDRLAKVVLATVACALATCAAPQPYQSVYPVPGASLPPASEWRPCIKREIDQRVAAAGWGGPGPITILGDETIESALSACLPAHVKGDVLTDSPAVGFAQGEYFAERGRIMETQRVALTAANEKKKAEDKAALQREEPAASAAYRTCIFTNAAGLALVSDEPAPVVASAAIAACRPQRDAWIAVHQRYGDGTFDNSVMDQIEQRILATLVLSVIQTRAAAKVTPPARAPKTVPSGDSI